MDTRNSVKSQNKTSIRGKLTYALAIIALLNLNEPLKAESLKTSNNIPENTENTEATRNPNIKSSITPQITEILENPDIVSNVEKRTGVKLPDGYGDKIRKIINNHDILKNNAQFIEDFVVKEMQTKRGINDGNQVLFIYGAMLAEHNEYVYNGEDGNKERMSQFESVIDNVIDCQKRYQKEFLEHLEQNIDNSQQRINNSQQRINNSQQRINNSQQRIDNINKETMKLDSIGVKQMIEFYDIYITHPNIVKQDDIIFMKESTKEIINQCIEYGIDFRAILLKEVGDEDKVNAIINFYTK